ncbi:Lon protease family protein [Candidatus Binatus soli]|jgi:ATP-dependent Lon protease|uniref:Lon protease family protein n=1 Tax=Candidatus Binatus soli TaxID=1953413 RepID=UPI003D0E9F54
MADKGDLIATDAGAALIHVPPPAELDAAELKAQVLLDAASLERAASGDGDLELFGQGRALDAIRLAIGIDAAGYNVFVSGLRSRHERESVLRLLREKAATMPTPGDWVYVNNFRNPESPVAICLQPGQGVELRTRMTELIGFVLEQLPKAFRREDFDQERAALRDKYNKRAQELFGNLETRARERGFALQSAPTGQVIFIPLIDGKMPESPEVLGKAMAAKTDAEREQLAKVQGDLQDELGTLMLKQQEMMHELIDDIRAIERAFAARLITPSIEELKHHFNNPAVDAYLHEVADHMLGNLDRFREPPPEQGARPPGIEDGARWFDYQVNVMVDNSATRGAPVVLEDAPTYRNLFGTIERWIDPLGRSGTNFTRIIGGSFLKSHGGFLVFDLEDAVVEPSVWKTLKRSLKSGRMTPETFEPLPFFSMSGLKPEPIEIRNKVVVLGGAYLYSVLYFYEPDFADLFKVKAEMRPSVAADGAAAAHYAAHVGALARRENLPPFEAGALARIVEFGMRMAGDRSRVLAMLEPIDDLARESGYFARIEMAKRVTGAHVERALGERMLRLNFIEEEIRRLIGEGTLIVHIRGASVGQINGLAVLDVGGYSFGRPARVTATVALGQAGVINIEREARMSGSTHDKGIMILSGFIRARFGQQHPIAMTAGICFEQSYSGIDGDSASSTELYALLSALSGVPLRQDLAVTGSVDQYGTVQAIGGVNQKVEGFYRVCKAIGLTGTQGVIVPRTNVSNLMLDPETTGAIERGEFHIYPIDTIDRGIEALTGVRAGTIDEPGTINHLVDRQLKRMADILRERPLGETRVVQEPAPNPPAPKPPAPPEPPR